MLEPLFAKGLDADRAADDYLFDTQVALPQGSKVKVPYLNGGLFERDALDEIPTKFPSQFFADLLNFLYQYNFTIDENDPDDAQVGVDPEMLGRIFENLLEDNKDKGAFYTPKEIVRYMCRQSLTAYLCTSISNEGEQQAIGEYVKTYDVAHLGGASSPLAQFVDERLKEVKICDPAIGSGAFPMGMLKELFLCRSHNPHGRGLNAPPRECNDASHKANKKFPRIHTRNLITSSPETQVTTPRGDCPFRSGLSRQLEDLPEALLCECNHRHSLKPLCH